MTEHSRSHSRSPSESRLVGVGIYSAAEASRLTGISYSKIRSWLWGRAGERPVRPLWSPEVPEIDGLKALGFRDLIEIQFIDAFRKHGVSLQEIRRARRSLRSFPHAKEKS